MLFPEDVSLHGHLLDEVFWLGFALTGVTFLLVIGILVTFLIRYRARAGHQALYTHGESRGARILTLTLALAVFVLIDINLAYHDDHAWRMVLGSPPARSESVVVQVLAQQFEWKFRLAGADGAFGTEDDVTTTNRLLVPVGKDVVFDLRSKETIHSFFLPNFRVKQDVLPGLKTSMYVRPVKEGTFEVACAELCGLGHYRMRGRLEVVSAEKFEAWMAETVQDYGADLEAWKPWDEAEKGS